MLFNLERFWVTLNTPHPTESTSGQPRPSLLGLSAADLLHGDQVLRDAYGIPSTSARKKKSAQIHMGTALARQRSGMGCSQPSAHDGDPKISRLH